jgi:uncharacterized protein (TIGR02271 family)
MTDFSENINGSDIEPRLIGARIVDADGRQAHVVSIDKNELNPTVAVRLEHGPEMVLPLSLLSGRSGDEYRLSLSFATLQDMSTGSQQVVIPVMQEELRIDKRVVDTGKGLRVRKTVSEHEQVIDQPLLHDELVVEHVPVGQMVTASELPTTRYDGDTLVVPVFEEVLVVEKQTRLKEEVRITRRKRETHAPQSVVLKSEQVSVERFDEQRELFHPSGVPQSSHQSKSEPGKSAE